MKLPKWLPFFNWNCNNPLQQREIELIDCWEKTDKKKLQLIFDHPWARCFLSFASEKFEQLTQSLFGFLFFKCQGHGGQLMFKIDVSQAGNGLPAAAWMYGVPLAAIIELNYRSLSIVTLSFRVACSAATSLATWRPCYFFQPASMGWPSLFPLLVRWRNPKPACLLAAHVMRRAPS